MRWCTGWAGRSVPPVRPLGGWAVPGWDAVWAVGRPREQVRAVRAGDTALAVIGECGAEDAQLAAGLRDVRCGRWRELTVWPGSHLVLVAHGPQTLVIGDLAGQHPVYWRQTGGGVWWASAASALAALDGAPVDAVALAAHLAIGQPDLMPARSLFRGVQRVPPGWLLRIDAGAPVVERFEPVEYEPVPMAQAGPVVAGALRAAVTARIDGRRAVSADLAGLDSTTLACLAADHGPTIATTFTDPRLRDDDLAYARRTAAAVAGLRHRVVSGGPGTVYYSGLEDLEHLPVTDAPNPYAVTAGIKRAVLAAAVEGGSGRGVHFAGTGGDTVLSATGYLPDLLRERRWGTAVSHAQARARVGRTSLWTVLRRARRASRATPGSSVRAAVAELRAPAGPWLPGQRVPLSRVPLLAGARWMDQPVRDRLAEALGLAVEQAAMVGPGRLSGWTERADLLHLGADMAGWRALAIGFGVEVAAPYLDNEVLRACLAVRPEERGAPGVYKPLLTAAFPNGPVPPFVLGRVTKGGFNGVSYAGLVGHADTIAELLGPASRLASLGLLTPGPVEAMLRLAGEGQRVPQGSLHLAVATEVWLRQLDLRPVAWWEEVANRVATA
ncbi:albusnodin/ikarugamycin family macrolactam cyclase [Streptomyces alkaliphilus]|uniref:albusnodin/ikarugamycin family macrolactam cyclase n=1 Tax=Streptomyces alkaliphilus TaxID=1472722 RepID=UPI0015644710